MARTLLILAGGTGGHIMPALAIARALRARGWEIRWIGSAHGMENTLVPQAGITLDTIPFSGLRGKDFLDTLKGIWQLIVSCVICLGLLTSIRPDAVLGMGAYLTVPGGLLAALLRRPLVLMNSDSSLLVSNKILLPLARKILFGLPGNLEAIGAKAQWTGCPVREEIAEILEPEERLAYHGDRYTLLIMGGSLGAEILNQIIPAALALIPEEMRPRVIHQSGAQHIQSLKLRYQKVGVNAEVVAFIDDIAQSYSAADLVLCRAGAITVSELAVAGVASILVPFVATTTQHQQDNAEYMQRAGAALHLPQESLTANMLAQLLMSMSRERILAMSIAARLLAKPQATQTVVEVLENL